MIRQAIALASGCIIKLRRMLKLINPIQAFRFSSKAKILISNCRSIHFNLAYEEYLFESNHLDCPTLLLYQNSPTIVIGRHQNPWKECRNQEMKANGVSLARRKTGGGAVYQDLGNSCFSFLTPYDKSSSYDYKTVNNKILTTAFASVGIPIEVAGRNDMHCQDRKMSGSAYRLHLGGKGGQGKKALHHGTILFDVDLNALQKYLNPNKKKLQSKGIESVISRVMNLNEVYPAISHENYCKQLEQQFQKHYNCTAERQILNEEQLLAENETLRSNYERLKSWDWLFGQCPEFKYTIDNKFVWGMTEVTYNVVDGFIKEAKVYSDCLFPDFIEIINEEIVKGVRYDKEGLGQFQNQLSIRLDEQLQPMASQLCKWMQEQL